MAVDLCLAIPTIAEVASPVLDLLNPSGEPLAHGVGQPLLVVGQDDIHMSANGGLCSLADRSQSTVGRPEAPPSLSANLTAHCINCPNCAVDLLLGRQRQFPRNEVVEALATNDLCASHRLLMEDWRDEQLSIISVHVQSVGAWSISRNV